MRGLEVPDLESGVEGESPVAKIEVPVEGHALAVALVPTSSNGPLDPGRGRSTHAS